MPSNWHVRFCRRAEGREALRLANVLIAFTAKGRQGFTAKRRHEFTAKGRRQRSCCRGYR